MEDNNLENNWNILLKKEFETIHKDYCKHFKKFIKEFDEIFANMSKEEYEKFIPSRQNYAKIMDYSKMELEDFMEDVNITPINGLQRMEYDNALLKIMMLNYIITN